MSASIHELSDFISELLMVERFRDACENGLQVEGKGEVERIALGVSVTQALLDEAVGWQADAVLTHHGLFWQRDKQSIRGLRRQRLKTLLANDIHLLAYHLPLDAHPVLGNNAQLAQVISLTEVSPWLLVDGVPLGVIGSYPQPMSAAELEAQLALVFGARVLLLGERSRVVQRVAICSGRAASSLEEAARAGADLYLTGEADEGSRAMALELGILMAAAGHYNTETFGVRALGKRLEERFGVSTRFFFEPNPI